MPQGFASRSAAPATACDVVVSADVSPSERKPAFFVVIAASVFNSYPLRHITILDLRPPETDRTHRAPLGETLLRRDFK